MRGRQIDTLDEEAHGGLRDAGHRERRCFFVFDQFPRMLQWGSLRVAPHGILVWRDESPVRLTLRQFSTLMALLAEPHRAQSREEIWQFCLAQERRPIPAQPGDPRAVDVYVAQLRRKLGRDSVVTVRGVGYRLGPARVQDPDAVSPPFTPHSPPMGAL